MSCKDTGQDFRRGLLAVIFLEFRGTSENRCTCTSHTSPALSPSPTRSRLHPHYTPDKPVQFLHLGIRHKDVRRVSNNEWLEPFGFFPVGIPGIFPPQRREVLRSLIRAFLRYSGVGQPRQLGPHLREDFPTACAGEKISWKFQQKNSWGKVL